MEGINILGAIVKGHCAGSQHHIVAPQLSVDLRDGEDARGAHVGGVVAQEILGLAKGPDAVLACSCNNTPDGLVSKLRPKRREKRGWLPGAVSEAMSQVMVILDWMSQTSSQYMRVSQSPSTSITFQLPSV
jgi:hypothetical protein